MLTFSSVARSCRSLRRDTALHLGHCGEQGRVLKLMKDLAERHGLRHDSMNAAARWNHSSGHLQYPLYPNEETMVLCGSRRFARSPALFHAAVPRPQFSPHHSGWFWFV